MRISDWSSDVCSSDLKRVNHRTVAKKTLFQNRSRLMLRNVNECSDYSSQHVLFCRTHYTVSSISPWARIASSIDPIAVRASTSAFPPPSGSALAGWWTPTLSSQTMLLAAAAALPGTNSRKRDGQGKEG